MVIKTSGDFAESLGYCIIYRVRYNCVLPTTYNKQIQKVKSNIMNTIRGFWQHANGKIYAIESTTFGKIIAGVGPLGPNDLRNLDDYDYKPAIKEWLEEAVAKRKLRRINPH